MSNTKDFRTVAVLTGDIVKSRKRSFDDLRALGNLLREAVQATSAAMPDAGVSKIDIFRGDSWQLLVKRPERALRVALFIRTYLQGGEARERPLCESRIGIGIGEVDWANEDEISQSHGSAFVASGEALDRLAGSRRDMALSFAAGNNRKCAETAVVLLDALIQRWTPKQAWAIHGAMRGLTQEEIAAAFVPAIGRRTAGDHLEKAGWNAVETALNWWEEEQT